jgi:GNAT superfamily N-acetyltransferase
MELSDLADRITFVPLREHQHHIPQLALWHHGQWAALNPGETLDGRRKRLEGHARNADLPMTWLALDGGVLLGSASLVQSDMEIRPELGPWLASVFVDPEQRGRHIGSLLVEHVAQEARARGFAELYLFTPDRQKFYERLGWRHREAVRYHETLVSLMKKDL